MKKLLIIVLIFIACINMTAQASEELSETEKHLQSDQVTQKNEKQESFKKIKDSQIKACAKIAGKITLATLGLNALKNLAIYRYDKSYFQPAEDMDEALYESDLDGRTYSLLKLAKPLIKKIETVFDNPLHGGIMNASLFTTIDGLQNGLAALPITLVCRVGSWPKLEHNDLNKPLLISSASTAAIGSLVYGLARYKSVPRAWSLGFAFQAAEKAWLTSIAAITGWSLYKRYKASQNHSKKTDEHLQELNQNQ